jgi:hypothetical protein
MITSNEIKMIKKQRKEIKQIEDNNEDKIIKYDDEVNKNENKKEYHISEFVPLTEKYKEVLNIDPSIVEVDNK